MNSARQRPLSAIASLAILLCGCENACDSVRALQVAQADLKRRGSMPEIRTFTIRDEGTLWIVEHAPPPGGMGGASLHKIVKGRCSVTTAEIYQ